jgi:ABC-type dipeptide/oligopeptide/nickel transport system permease subunit
MRSQILVTIEGEDTAQIEKTICDYFVWLASWTDAITSSRGQISVTKFPAYVTDSRSHGAEEIKIV